jgi:hypothetical protein
LGAFMDLDSVELKNIDNFGLALQPQRKRNKKP